MPGIRKSEYNSKKKGKGDNYGQTKLDQNCLEGKPEKVKGPNPVPALPEWIKFLAPYFEFQSISKNTKGRALFTLKCCVCERGREKKTEEEVNEEKPLQVPSFSASSPAPTPAPATESGSQNKATIENVQRKDGDGEDVIILEEKKKNSKPRVSLYSNTSEFHFARHLQVNLTQACVF